MKRITSFLLAIVMFAGLLLTGAPTAHAASEMYASDALIEVLKKEEGFSDKPYWDYGQYTVGYGTRCPDDMLEEYQRNGITEEEAETLLRNYLVNTEYAINKKFIEAYGLSLTQNQFDALVTFTYNCGTGWISEAGGNFHNAVKNGATGSDLIWAFSLWCSAGGQILPGLVRRRLCEANMFLNGEYSTSKPSNYCYVYYNANGGSVSYRIQGYDANERIAPAYTPSYGSATFLGWFTDKTGGTQVKTLTADMSGTTLYAHWDGVEENFEQIPEGGVTVKVTGSDVNLRKGPGTNYGLMGTANKGDKLVITETASGSGYEWGKAGDKWIALQFTNYSEVVGNWQEKPETDTSKPEDIKPEDTKPETKPEDTKPEDTKPEQQEPEQTTVTGTIKADGGLALREGPGTGYGRIRYLANGSKVTILEQKKVGSMTWGRISEGWISMSYVILDATSSAPETSAPETSKPETSKPETSTPDATTTVTGTIKADGGLALRQGPGFGYARIKYLANGLKVTILEQKTADGMTWGRISEGWISMDYVVVDKAETKPETKPEQSAPETSKPEESKPEESKPEATEPEEEEPEDNTQTQQTKITGTVKADGGLAVRGGAGTSYAVKRYLSNGAKVTVTEVKDVNGTKWGNMGEGWISLDYVVVDGQQAEEETKEETTMTVIADCLRVRQSPSTSATIVGYYYQNAKVQILETKDVDGTTWGRTSQGWVSMDYVK